MNEFIPAEVFPPGEFLADEIEARGWTQVEFAKLIRRPTKTVNEIISGRKIITPETARELAAAFGTSPQYWLNLESAYQLWKTAPSASEGVIAREAKLRERYPLREMIKRGWIGASENFEVVAAQLYEFYGIANDDEEPVLMPHAAKKRNYDEPVSNLQEAWLFRVKQLATALRVPRYSRDSLLAAIKKLELLLTEPEEIRHVPQILAECGVRFVIVEPIPNSKIDGVCFWLDEGKSPVIALALKWDYIDRIWFYLRHEIEHVLREDGKDNPVIEDFESDVRSEDQAEKAADAAAENFCVPKAAMADFVVRHDPMYSHADLVGFSRVMKRHPGIVAGQLQRRIGRNDLFRKYQVRVREIITAAALTDGYGHEVPANL